VARVVLLNKPFGMLCQFTGPPGTPTLADVVDVPGVYPAGRLDTDSEGLLVLTDSGPLQARLSDPMHKTWKRYWVQVEGQPDDGALEALRGGVRYRDVLTLPARAERIDEPAGLWPRDPPVRFRAAIPTSWLCLEIREGRNRQVRHMTAAVGYPTLRLIRAQIGDWSLGDLAPGAWRLIETSDQTSEPRRTERPPETKNPPGGGFHKARKRR